MYSNTPSQKASKGTVQVIASNDRLQLRFRFLGKRHYLSLGLPDTSVNRKAAEAKARQIELDILSNNFDEKLAKYTPQSALSTATPEITPKPVPGASDLWRRYREYKTASLKVTTKGYHASLARILDKIPAHPISEALTIKTESDHPESADSNCRG